MRRALAMTVFLVLCGAACATAKKAPAGMQLATVLRAHEEAQQAQEEAQRAQEEAQRLDVAGQYVEAVSLLGRTCGHAESSRWRREPWMADCLALLGTIYQRHGDHSLAESRYVRALMLREVALGKHHPDTSKMRDVLIEFHLSLGELAKALGRIEDALAASEEHLRREVLGFSEARLASLLLRLRAEEERIYALVREYPEEERIRKLALATALLRKGRSVEEISNTSRTIYRGLVGLEDRETITRLRELRTQLAMLSFSGPGTLPSADFQQRLKNLATQGDALEADVAKRSAPLRALHALPPPDKLVDHVAAALPGDSALIEFIAYQHKPIVPRPGPPISEVPSGPRYLALLLFADGHTRAIDLGPAEPMDSAVLRLHKALALGSSSYQSLAQEFHALTFQRLVPLLDGARRLFLSPDGQLALIPFAALHDGKRFLVDAFDITYLTSGKDLLPRSENILLPRSVVVLADPDFNAASTRRFSEAASTERSGTLERFFSMPRSDIVEQSWVQLPGTRKEAEAIGRLIPHARLYLGSAATKDALLRLATPGLLHIATHGIFLEDAPVPVDARAVKNFGAVGAVGPLQYPADPLLRSGLVLTGAGPLAAQPGTRRIEDSLVTALELAGLNLWGTQLVVLSACDTGRGDIKPGQGVYGLRRALVVAGAETVVTSLWKVNDETTRELMESYYGNLLAGQGRTTALREAMRALRQKQPNPHFWAPFIAIGQDGPLRGLLPSRQAWSR